MNNLDRKTFENLTKTKVDIAIAYTTDSDEDAKYPARNFLQTVPDKLEKKKYDTLILQGGCNEISNIKIKQNFTPEDVKIWEDKVYQSRKKCSNLLRRALNKIRI